MKLKELLHNIIDVTSFNVEIKGVTCNPKRIKEGYLFICISKEHKRYINNIKILAIIANFIAWNASINIFYPNPQEIYSKIVSKFYKFEQPKYIAAVTGTNGKTSVVEFCRQIWQNAGYNAASI
ncbi:MAG: Mur ligase family protein, partial [Wolbachia pipientis]|nr:Mur ligase family protein [Wolbachia pipientis]